MVAGDRPRFSFQFAPEARCLTMRGGSSAVSFPAKRIEARRGPPVPQACRLLQLGARNVGCDALPRYKVPLQYIWDLHKKPTSVVSEHHCQVPSKHRAFIRQASNPSIERTFQRLLRTLLPAAHVRAQNHAHP